MNDKEMYTLICALQKSCGILFTGSMYDLNYFGYQQSNGCASNAHILMLTQRNEIFPWKRNMACISQFIYLQHPCYYITSGTTSLHILSLKMQNHI